MITIQNVGPYDDPDKGGERNYEIRINGRFIAAFKHRRINGLSRLLIEGSKAVEKEEHVYLSKLIHENKTQV